MKKINVPNTLNKVLASHDIVLLKSFKKIVDFFGGGNVETETKLFRLNG